MNLPKKAFDIEYGTQYRKEYMFLLSHGIQPTFVKHTKDFNIPVYKYKKTPELFAALAMFYDQEKYNNQYESMLNELNNATISYSGSIGDIIDFSNIPADNNVKDEILRLIGTK